MIASSGQMRYEVWKTRLTKSNRNIEIANPAAPTQARLARYWFHNNHAVIGNQTKSSSQTNGYEP